MSNVNRSFVSTDPVSHQGETNTWLTPLSIIEALGEFDLDPCGFPNHKTAKRLIVLPEDGLNSEWEGRVWLNPPYGKNTGAWLEKLANHGNGIALVFARTDTSWFQKVAHRASGICFIAGRISFLRPNFEKGSNAGAPSILIAFGSQNAESIRAIKGVIR